MFFSSERGWLGSSDPFYFSKPLELSVILHLCNMNNMFFITSSLLTSLTVRTKVAMHGVFFASIGNDLFHVLPPQSVDHRCNWKQLLLLTLLMLTFEIGDSQRLHRNHCNGIWER